MKIIFNASTLVRAVDVVKGFTPKKSNGCRPLLDCINIRVDDKGKVLLTATDSYIFASLEVKDATPLKNEGFKNELNLNAKKLLEIIKPYKKADCTMIEIDDNTITIKGIASYNVDNMEEKNAYPRLTIKNGCDEKASFAISSLNASRIFTNLSKEFERISMVKNSSSTLSFTAKNNDFNVKGIIAIMRED